MTSVIVWADNGNVVTLTPPGNMTVEQTLLTDLVPKDRPTFVKDSSELPDAIVATWVLDTEGNVTSDPSRAPVPPIVPSSNFVRVLADRGLFDQVNAAVEQADPLTKRLWLAPEFERSDPLLVGMATQLGLADQLDDLFRAAAALPS